MAKLLGETSLLFLIHPTLSEENMIEMAEIISQVMAQASTCRYFMNKELNMNEEQ